MIVKRVKKELVAVVVVVIVIIPYRVEVVEELVEKKEERLKLEPY